MCLNVTINRSGRCQRQRSRPPQAHERGTAGLSREKDHPRAGTSPRHASGTRRAASRERAARGKDGPPVTAEVADMRLKLGEQPFGGRAHRGSVPSPSKNVGHSDERRIEKDAPLREPREGTARGRRWRRRGWRRCRPRRSERARAPASRHARRDPPPAQSGKTCARQPDNREGGAGCRR